MSLPSVGDTVHYILPADGYHPGEHRDARVTAVRGNILDLVIHSHGMEDGSLYSDGDVLRLGVAFSPDCDLGTWHFANPEVTINA